MTTNQLAEMLGVTNRNLRKWGPRGYLKLAPINDPCAGHGGDSIWDPAAIDEAIAFKLRLDRRKLAKKFMEMRKKKASSKPQ